MTAGLSHMGASSQLTPGMGNSSPLGARSTPNMSVGGNPGLPHPAAPIPDDYDVKPWKYQNFQVL